MYNPFFSNFGFRNYNYVSPFPKTQKDFPSQTYTKDSPSKANISNETTPLTRSHEDSAFLEIFGVKLFFDDILILCLIFFLYSEGIKDEMLFISLILLLLS